MPLPHETLKFLLLTSESVDKAKKILDDYCPFKTVETQIAFICGLFPDKAVIGHEPKEKIDLLALLGAIIHS